VAFRAASLPLKALRSPQELCRPAKMRRAIADAFFSRSFGALLFELRLGLASSNFCRLA
jgi:hypothetical protein